ncbi:MAG: hypothetical protein QHH19_05795 [Candidatus Thermoplasmatota archaeon]|jgi:predicted DNA-binding protein (UPF0251 family)|nr:hypothetical protein [Candidatus Thermoplasmatota archaeon]
MKQVKNSVLFEIVLKAIYSVSSRRTSAKLAEEALGSTLRALERKYDFLKYVTIQPSVLSEGGLNIRVSPEIDSISPELIGKSIESIIRVVYNDINAEAGLFFITELKKYAGDDVSKIIQDYFVDLDQIQIEQHYAYNRRERKKAITEGAAGARPGKKPESLIGYSWGDVSHWKHEPGSLYCTIYDKEGKVLDRINLDAVIQNYVERLSTYRDIDPRQLEREARIYEKEYELLRLMFERDMNAETASNILRITKEELNRMIRKLSSMEMVQYVSYDTVELTNIGIGYVAKKEKNKKTVEETTNNELVTAAK